MLPLRLFSKKSLDQIQQIMLSINQETSRTIQYTSRAKEITISMNMTTVIPQFDLFILSQTTIKLKMANFTAYGRIIAHYKSFCVVLSLKKCTIY